MYEDASVYREEGYIVQYMYGFVCLGHERYMFYPLFLCAGSKAWHLYSVHGLPVDLMQLMAEERNLFIDLEGYDKAKQCYQVSVQVRSLPLFLVGMGIFSEISLRKRN